VKVRSSIHLRNHHIKNYYIVDTRTLSSPVTSFVNHGAINHQMVKGGHENRNGGRVRNLSLADDMRERLAPASPTRRIACIPAGKLHSPRKAKHRWKRMTTIVMTLGHAETPRQSAGSRSQSPKCIYAIVQGQCSSLMSPTDSKTTVSLKRYIGFPRRWTDVGAWSNGGRHVGEMLD
jgi:hypothetical protein